MSKITGVIIAKNEEKMIPDALTSLSFCDELLVIDSGSTDKTIEIAESKKAKVIKHAFNNFAQMRELAIKNIETDWIFYLDADERVTDELREEIKSVISKDNFSAYRVNRRNYYLGNNLWPKTEKMERLFRKDSLKGWKGILHETPIFEGELGDLKGFIDHYTHRDLTSMLNKTIEWSKYEAQLRIKANHPQITWWRIIRVMLTTFFDYYIKQRGYSLGAVGLIESIYQSFSTFVTYARLWEMQKGYEDIK